MTIGGAASVRQAPPAPLDGAADAAEFVLRRDPVTGDVVRLFLTRGTELLPVEPQHTGSGEERR